MKKKIIIGSAVVVGCLLIVALIVGMLFWDDIASKEKPSSSDNSSTVSNSSTSDGLDENAATERVAVPNVCNLSRDEAEKTLKDLGLNVSVTEAFNKTYKSGTVMSQSIAGGTVVNQNTSILIIVSKGEDLVSVPDLVGKTLDEANELMKNAGIQFKTDLKCSNKVKEGNIVSQDVKAGQQVDRGTTVTAYISAGVSNTKGTTANHANGSGDVVLQGDWIYFTNQNNYCKLYKMRKDGTDKQILSHETITLVNVLGEWVYCHVAGSNSGIYKIKIDGSETIKLNSDYPLWLYVEKGWIYYTDIYNQQLYRVKTDGSGKMTISSDSCETPVVNGDWIYYVEQKSTALYKVKTNGTEKTQVLSYFEGSRLLFDKGTFYAGGSYVQLSKYSSDFKDTTYYEDDKYQINVYDVVDGWIYFTRFDKRSGSNEQVICRAKPDFSQCTELFTHKGNAPNVNVYLKAIGDWVYFKNGFYDDEMCRVNIKTKKIQYISR
ncbi:MAG: DUF5050 domain-containing protein [Clostridia bacterium]|nr:DUF5050 domain-containing protein [Clostridia bacterium]